MSFLIVGSIKGRYDSDELKEELKNRGAADPDSLLVQIAKQRKILFKGLRIMLLA